MKSDNFLDFYLHNPIKLSDIEIENIDWRDTTNDFGYFGVSKVINAFGASNEEKRKLIETICKVARKCNKTFEPIVHDLMKKKI